MWHNLKLVGCYEGGNKEASSLSEIRDRSELSGEGSMDQGTQKSGHAKSHGATWRRNRCWGGTKIKYCKTAETGHRSDPGTLGKGTKRRRAGRSLC